MGYDTNFRGKLVFKDQKELTSIQALYLDVFSMYQHCQVDEDIVVQVEDPLRTMAGLPLGSDNCFFLDSGVLLNMWAAAMFLISNVCSLPDLSAFAGRKRSKVKP